MKTTGAWKTNNLMSPKEAKKEHTSNETIRKI